MLINKIIKFLTEAEVIINKGDDKNGNIVFLLGGGGSAKVFDVDVLKKMVVFTARKKDKDEKLKNINFKNAEDVSFLHDFIDEKEYADKEIASFIKSIENNKIKPNIIFNITGKNEKTIIKRLTSSFSDFNKMALKDLYNSSNIHIVWVLTPFETAFGNNGGRDRVVSKDVLYSTHQGVKRVIIDKFFSGIGELQHYINGNVFIVFNKKGVDFSTNYKGHEGSFIPRTIKSKKERRKEKEKLGIDANLPYFNDIYHAKIDGSIDKSLVPNITGTVNYVQIKKKNEPVIPFEKLPKKYQEKIKEYTEGL